MSNKAILFLKDGFFLEGYAFSLKGEAIGEVVFNTSMSGYQEILTDPSYRGQMVCMNYPLIGNYGITKEDFESDKAQVAGFIIKENARIYTNHQAYTSLQDFLIKNKIVAIAGIDTRALVRHIRIQGAMKGIISTETFDKKALKAKLDSAPEIEEQDLIAEVACAKPYEWGKKSKAKGLNVAVVDCGVKHSILRKLKERFAGVYVFPPDSGLNTIMKVSPSAVLFSNGPGDPRNAKGAIALAKELIDGLTSKKVKVAVMGICLGHQILGLAFGAQTKKLKFGHHGGNHPVKDLSSGRIDITAQNHNYVVNFEAMQNNFLIQTHINLYDKTSEGMRHKKLPVFSLQFHPEACPGPFDADYIFDSFKEEAERIAENA